jgi:hypothetical protein
MIKTYLIAAAIVITSIVSSQAHCGTCDHKDDKKATSEQKDGEKKDGEKKEAVKTDEKK